ncbi:hypothetical protein P691DRAFT_783508, partial [Macrolepiota fuliginosa MF-IS2]
YVLISSQKLCEMGLPLGHVELKGLKILFENGQVGKLSRHGEEKTRCLGMIAGGRYQFFGPGAISISYAKAISFWPFSLLTKLVTAQTYQLSGVVYPLEKEKEEKEKEKETGTAKERRRGKEPVPPVEGVHLIAIHSPFRTNSKQKDSPSPPAGGLGTN